MNKTKIEIAKKSLKLLEKHNMQEITIKKVLGNSKINGFKTNRDLLININKFFDYNLKKNLSSLDGTSSKDLLFEVIMARFDILNNYRKQIKKIIIYLESNPLEVLKLLPPFIESIILTGTLAEIKINGLKGAANIKALLILYIITSYTWRNDESESLEKTMTTLDKYLTQIDKIIKIFT